MASIQVKFLGVVRGSKWYSGGGISGNNTTPMVYQNSGVSKAYIDDYYINLTASEDRGKIYVCTKAGAPDEAEWAYDGSIAGPEPDLINSVNSTSTTKALTANMGRYLFELIQSSVTYTRDIFPNVTKPAAAIRVTFENKDTTFTIHTKNDDVSIPYQADSSGDIVTKTYQIGRTTGFTSDAEVVSRIEFSDATLRSYALLDSDSNVIQEETPSIWNHINIAENNISEGVSLSEAYESGGEEKTASFQTARITKVLDGIRRTLFPVTHVKAVWWNVNDSTSLYDYLVEQFKKADDHFLNKKNPHGVTYEQAGAPPKNHASTNTDYGIGSQKKYGHLRVGNGLNVTNGIVSWDEEETSEQEVATMIKGLING